MPSRVFLDRTDGFRQRLSGSQVWRERYKTFTFRFRQLMHDNGTLFCGMPFHKSGSTTAEEGKED